VNVGAGTGNYEPRAREVTAVEPSAAMIAQRRGDAAPAVRAPAEALPLGDNSFDAAMAVMTLHHWDDVPRGLAELGRVARDRVVIFTWDPALAAASWLQTDYLPEIAVLDSMRFPAPADLARALGGRSEILPVPIPHDCEDGFLEAWWARPQAFLDPAVRAGTSAMAQLPAWVLNPALERLRADLESGVWHRRHGHLLDLDELDLGYRLLVAELTKG